MSRAKIKYLVRFAAVSAIAFALEGCNTVGGKVAGAAAAAIGYSAQSPSAELHQIYYLGIFDPTSQLPEAFYRVTVRGQASALSRVDFQSGWVPAPFVDSLGSTLQIKPAADPAEGSAGEAEVTKSASPPDREVAFPVGRRLVLFGPEGFRESPKNHRLVILMGQDASAFFDAVDSALGTVAGVESTRNDETLRAALLRSFTQISRRGKVAAELRLEASQLGLSEDAP